MSINDYSSQGGLEPTEVISVNILRVERLIVEGGGGGHQLAEERHLSVRPVRTIIH